MQRLKSLESLLMNSVKTKNIQIQVFRRRRCQLRFKVVAICYFGFFLHHGLTHFLKKRSFHTHTDAVAVAAAWEHSSSQALNVAKRRCCIFSYSYFRSELHNCVIVCVCSHRQTFALKHTLTSSVDLIKSIKICIYNFLSSTHFSVRFPCVFAFAFCILTPPCQLLVNLFAKW